MSTNPGKIGFISLGCAKALVDSERIITQLRAEGYDIWPSYQGADLVVVNTCGFIESAIEESLDAIGEALEENGKVVVTGCLGAKGTIVGDTYPQLLAVTGPHDTDAVMAAIHDHLPPPHDPFTSLIPPQGIRLTPRHYAYLKISEGCNHHCSFCIIPALRGRLVSRPVEEVMEEAQALANAGVKELLVVAQDTSAYGLDIKYRPGIWQGRALRSHITDLAQALGELGIWIRMHYLYPYPHLDDLIPLMADGLILPYLDVPMQHASPAILKAMKRPASDARMLERIHSWREQCPQLAIRSTFIVGFPGETEEDFSYLLDFLSTAELDRVGCFTYSPVEGADANALPDPVPEEIQLERQTRLMEHQAAISARRLASRIGQTLTVLVDEVGPEQASGRSYADAPDVDGQVWFTPAEGLSSGDLCEVTITDSDDHDLQGHLV